MKPLWAIPLCACLLLGTSARAEDLGESVRVSMNGGLSNQYYFRGLRQGAKGVVMQGAAALRVALADDEDFKFQTVAGAFVSLHPGDQRNGDGFSAALLELRSWGGLGVWTPYMQVEGSFYAYTSPNRSFEDVLELDLVGHFFDDYLWAGDDDDHLFRGFFPSVTLAQEVKGARDGGGNGTYLEFSAAPRLRLLYGAILNVEFAFPVALGMSLNDYYQIPARPSGKIESAFLGYAAVGFLADFDYRWVLERLGAWRGRLGFDVLLPRAQNDADVLHVNTVEAVVRGELVFDFWRLPQSIHPHHSSTSANSVPLPQGSRTAVQTKVSTWPRRVSPKRATAPTRAAAAPPPWATCSRTSSPASRRTSEAGRAERLSVITSSRSP